MRYFKIPLCRNFVRNDKEDKKVLNAEQNQSVKKWVDSSLSAQTKTVDHVQVVSNTVHGTVEIEHAKQSPVKTLDIGQIYVGTIPISCQPLDIQPLNTEHPPHNKTQQSKPSPISKKSKKSKKSKSVDSSRIRRSNRIASGCGRKPAIDTNVYTITDEDSEETHSDSSPTKSAPDIRTYSRRPSSSKSLPKASQSSEEDTLVKNLKKLVPLINQNSLENFEKFSKRKPVLPGRVFNFNDLINTDHDLTKYTNLLGWTKLFNIKETYYPSLISAFYFNAVVLSEKDQIVSDLKGIKVKVTEELLGKLLEIPTEGNKVYGINWFSKLCVDRTSFMKQIFEPGTPLTKDPPSSKLKHELKMIHNVCLHSIFPRKGSKDKVTHNDMMIMYHLSQQIKLNLPYVLIQHMINTIENENKKVTLPYGMFLTRVFREFKVSFVGEESKNTYTTFTTKNIDRMKRAEDLPSEDHGQKRKREIFEQNANLDLLAEVVTTQEDRLENILPTSVPCAKGKEVLPEGNPIVSEPTFVSLEFDATSGENLNSSLNKFTSILLNENPIYDNPVNTSLSPPFATSPHKTFDSFHTSEFLRDLIRTPLPEFPKMPQPIFTDAGPSLPSFPSNFASLASFCTNSYTNAAQSNSEAIPPFDSRALKRSKVEIDILQTKKNVAKMYELVDTMYSYMKLEFSTIRTWLVDEFCPAMRANPPPAVVPPPVPDAPKFDNMSSSDDSSPTIPQ
ncbi:hypothetical protein TSUD_409590 [Trifolium subterraneum]|uniref:Putative plant transposon protein domain-containing protein n=1 Tax=Trifolium subterraneum TaxID=3900 RepID=A0A2Z6P3W7_TRISU|nr:hypothetical protein TSUD_409590 [Trifolium subterraneum]